MRLKNIIFSVIVLLIIISCKKKNWNNPYDEEPSTYFDWAPFISSIKQVDETIVLEFGSNETNFDSYVIERSVDNGAFSKVASPSNTSTSWTDNNITSGGKVHKYKIYAKAGSNASNSVETEITPKLAPKFDVTFNDITVNSFSYDVNITDNGSSIYSVVCDVFTDENLSSLYRSYTGYNRTCNELKDSTTFYVRFFIHNSFKDIYSKTYSITTLKIHHVYWEDDLQLGSQYSTDFYTIQECENLTISDNVEVTNIGTSEVIIKVAKTLTLGKNVVIRVRNGFYEKAPENKPENFEYSGNTNNILFPKTYGKGGDGGDTTGPAAMGGGGGGGYGGGNGGHSNVQNGGGKPNGGDGGKSYWSVTGETGGGRYHVGGNGSSATGGGGNGGKGGGYFNNSYGGGGGGYGGGILVIVAQDIVFDNNYPPRFLVSGQKGGTGGNPGNNDGGNGQGGILIINCPSYTADSKHYNLNSQTFGTHETSYSKDNGHGIVTGNPTKVYVNGILQ
jgi:hypothetical protein